MSSSHFNLTAALAEVAEVIYGCHLDVLCDRGQGVLVQHIADRYQVLLAAMIQADAQRQVARALEALANRLDGDCTWRPHA